MKYTLYDQLLDLADEWDVPGTRRGDDYTDGIDDGKSHAARELRTFLTMKGVQDELHA